MDDLIDPLGIFYFSSSHHGIVKRTPKKRKLDESSSHPKYPQVLVWNMTDTPPKQMVREAISTMWTFTRVTSYTVEEVIVEMEKKEM